jgi:Mg/Co/Ni transporter MgtE
MEALTQRVTALEEWRHRQDVADAVRAEQAKHIDERFDSLDKKVDKGFTRLDGLVSRIVWLIITALVGGVMAFILGGGLASVG